MKIGSLFSGIGGFELAAEWCGHRTIWQSEIDPYCTALLAERFPGVPNLGDITTIDWSGVERPDIICGGFPCQDISYAGKGAGLEGKRSGLWYEFARAIREVGPRYVVVENVRALFTRGFDAVLGTLADLGYDGEWSMYGAADVGAPHRRHRVWILAYANAERQSQPEGIEPDIRRRAGNSGGESDVAHPEGEQRHRGIGHRDQAGRDGPAIGGEDVADTGRGRCGGAGARKVQLSRGTEAVGGSEALADTQRERSQGQQQAGPAAGAVDRSRDGRDPGWWAVEPRLGQPADGLPPLVDRTGGGVDGKAKGERPTEGLSRLRGNADQEDVRGETGGPPRVPASEILRPIVHGVGLCQRCAYEVGTASSGDEVARQLLRILWGEDAPSRASHRREAAEQLSREYPDLVRELSRHAPPPCQACWSSGRWEVGVPRVAHGVSKRVHRLRGLGNAIVPACALPIFRRIAELEGEVTG